MGAVLSSLRLNASAPSRTKLSLVAVTAFWMVHLLNGAKKVVGSLGLINVVVALVRNAACVLKNLQEDFGLPASLPRAPVASRLLPAVSPVRIATGVLQQAGCVLNLYLALRGARSTFAERKRLREWLCAARRLRLEPLPEGGAVVIVDGDDASPAMVEARAQLVKELSGAVAAAGPTNHVCRALLGAGFFWFGASSFRWCAVRPVGYASTWMLAALVPVLLGASQHVSAVEADCRVALRLLRTLRQADDQSHRPQPPGDEQLVSWARAPWCGRFFWRLLPAEEARRSAEGKAVRCWAADDADGGDDATPVPLRSPAEMEARLLAQVRAVAADNDAMARALSRELSPSKPVRSELAQVAAAVQKSLSGCRVDRAVIALNWGAFVGYFQLLVTFYSQERTVQWATGGLWPGHGTMAKFGNMLGDVCWTIESLLILFCSG